MKTLLLLQCNSSIKGTSSQMAKAGGASIGLQQTKRMSLSVCTDSANMQNGISESMMATPRTPNGDINFHMATSKKLIAVGCLLCKIEHPETGIPKPKIRRT